VSRTPGVDEHALAVGPARLAVAGRAGGDSAVDIVLLDQGPRAEQPWTLPDRVAAGLSSVQLWGQASAPRRLRLELGQAEIEDLLWRGEGLLVRTDHGEVYLDPEGSLSDSALPARLVEPRSARPDLFRWAVDELRHSELVGPRGLQALEQGYLDAADAFRALAAGELDARRARSEPTPVTMRAAAGPSPRWPPPPLAPMIAPPLVGEGEWQERDQAFVTSGPAGPPLLYSTFVRTDPDRLRSSRVLVTVWDPALLELHWIAGTMEPRSAFGHMGTGLVPREHVDRLVAGFNGGFQAVDGAFGMRTAEGRFLPPVPYGATVAALPGGRIGLGTWPPGAIEEPAEYRQNLTALVEDGVANPYGRTFWGGVPREIARTARTDRTGLCLTGAGHLAYFWGRRVTVDALARGMIAASCDYGIMLDINFSNTAFETYRVAPRGRLPALDRPLAPETEAQGIVPDRPDLEYRVQAMADGMTRVGFPRFVRTELRDFFYLLAREDTPGSDGPGSLPMALRIFTDTRAVPPAVWAPIHRRAQRRIDDLGLSRRYVQIRHYRRRDMR
jgi:hypothetical protein